MDYLPSESELLPEAFRGKFFFATSSGDKSGIMMLGYDLEERVVDVKPSYFVRLLNAPGVPGVTATAFGPDGLYFARVLPDSSGSSAIYKVVPNEASDHEEIIGQAGDLITASGCLNCHSRGGEGASVGPSLDFDRVRLDRLHEQLSSEEYVAQVASVDEIDEEPFNQYQAARQDVLNADDDEKVRLWLTYRILEPRFDSPTVQMPTLGLSRDQADEIVTVLLEERRGSGESLAVRAGESLRELAPFFPRTRAGDFLAGIFFGGIAGALAASGGLAVLLGVWWFVRRARRHTLEEEPEG